MVSLCLRAVSTVGIYSIKRRFKAIRSRTPLPQRRTSASATNYRLKHLQVVMAFLVVSVAMSLAALARPDLHSRIQGHFTKRTRRRKKLEVPPGQAVLLQDRDKYPTGDTGVQFRLLSDFLDPEKISPLQVRDWLITEAQFGLIRDDLQKYILEYLQGFSDILGDCTCNLDGIVYLTENDGKMECRCYNPKLPPISSFGADTEGWTTKNGATAAVYVDSGGNPGGHIEATDSSVSAAFWYFEATGKFHGNFLDCTLRFDLKIFANSDTFNNDIILGSSAGEFIYYKFAENPGTEWLTFEASLSGDDMWINADGQAASSEKVKRVVQDTTLLQIRGDHVYGEDTTALDNAAILC